MHKGKYVFSQMMDTVRRYDFNHYVERYQGDHHVKNFSCWEQFLALSFGQLSFRKSLRDIVTCLTAHQEKMYHMGFRSLVRRSTLSEANEHRDWRIYRDFALSLITEARVLYVDDRIQTLEISEALYVIDSTTIELCLPLFPWAKIPHEQAAIKLNMGIELHGNIPSFFSFSKGTSPDVLFLDQIHYEKEAYYIFDRGYVDFKRFYAIHTAGAFFVTRSKKYWSFRRLYSRPTDKTSGVRCDQVVIQGRHHHVKTFPSKMRRIVYVDSLTKIRYIFVTNNFELSALTIAEIYKQRWQVELFFKWMKQHLAIEVFWGRNSNAVKTQICIAISVYLLVAILKKRLKIERNSYEILQILSVSLFDKIPIFTLISQHELQNRNEVSQKQARLWDY
jgi:hypothetical protein